MPTTFEPLQFSICLSALLTTGTEYAAKTPPEPRILPYLYVRLVLLPREGATIYIRNDSWKGCIIGDFHEAQKSLQSFSIQNIGAKSDGPQAVQNTPGNRSHSLSDFLDTSALADPTTEEITQEEWGHKVLNRTRGIVLRAGCRHLRLS